MVTLLKKHVLKPKAYTVKKYVQKPPGYTYKESACLPALINTWSSISGPVRLHCKKASAEANQTSTHPARHDLDNGSDSVPSLLHCPLCLYPGFQAAVKIFFLSVVIFFDSACLGVSTFAWLLPIFYLWWFLDDDDLKNSLTSDHLPLLHWSWLIAEISAV